MQKLVEKVIGTSFLVKALYDLARIFLQNGSNNTIPGDFLDVKFLDQQVNNIKREYFDAS